MPALALVGLLTISMGAGAAQAAPDYPASQPPSVSSATVTPGVPFVFSASGFTPGEIIDITATLNTASLMRGPAGSLGGGMSMSRPMILPAASPESFTATAAADGSFSASIALTEVGAHTLTATGKTSGKTVTQTVTVVDGVEAAAVDTEASSVQGENDSNLANTGINSGVALWAIVGALALLAGFVTVATSRRSNA